MMARSFFTFLFTAVVASATSVQADVLYLKNGGRLEGELLNPEQTPRKTFEFKTSSGARLVLAGSQVQRFEIPSDAERGYQAAVATLPDTVAAHWDMAERCQRAGLQEHREFHLRQVLRHDPDHEQARHRLGYSRIDGRWVLQEDWMERQGFVRHRGGWRLPQELELERREEETEEKIVAWKKKLRVWRDWIIKGPERRVQGEHEIRMIRDPLAATALADLLESEKEPRPLKLLYIEVLGRLASPAAIGSLIQHALHDGDAQVRDACLDELVRLKSRAATDAFIAALQHEENYMVHRAAAGLARMNDPRATLPLIDALITEHKQLVGGGSGINTSFSNRGGSGLSFGGGPKVKRVKKQNQPVLHALNALHRGVNYGFNQKAWKNWYIAQHTPPSVSLRRSD